MKSKIVTIAPIQSHATEKPIAMATVASLILSIVVKNQLQYCFGNDVLIRASFHIFLQEEGASNQANNSKKVF